MNYYRIRLVPDTELLAKSVGIYRTESLFSSNHALDSELFGSTPSNPICSICKWPFNRCLGHFSVIQLPFPIVRAICISTFKKLVPLLCPICSHFIIPNVKKALKQPVTKRLNWIKKETEKHTAMYTKVVTCPNCKEKIQTIQVTQDEPALRFEITLPSDGTSYQINPVHLQILMQNFVEEDEGGFNPYYSPTNFMTSFIPIVPNKLRPKTMSKVENDLDGLYKPILTEIYPKLLNIKKQVSLQNSVIFSSPQMLQEFNKYYDKLMGLYLRITASGSAKTQEEELKLLNKRDRKHAENHKSLIQLLKGDGNLFELGILDSRVNVSARTVLGGSTDSDMQHYLVPHTAANKMYSLYPVYKQNINAMKQLIMLWSDKNIFQDVETPRILGIWNSRRDTYIPINEKNYMARAMMLQPGDKLAISLMNCDFAFQSRFPSLSEESWTSFKVERRDTPILSIPLPVCKSKSADFDGDEVQIYPQISHAGDAENILLHSVGVQTIGYKHGGLAYQYQADCQDGIEMVNDKLMMNLFNYHVIKPTNSLELAALALPPHMNYKDKNVEIKDGKFVNNGKPKLRSHDLHKYVAFTYGLDALTKLMSDWVQLAYMAIECQGATQGFEINISNEKRRKEIEKLKEETLIKIEKIERSNTEYKLYQEKVIQDELKTRVLEMIKEEISEKILGKQSYAYSRLEEFFSTAVYVDYTIVDGGDRIQPILAEGSRTTCAFPRYSVNPEAYGFNQVGYAYDPSPVTAVYDSKAARTQLFQKSSKTGQQGYFSKRTGVCFSHSVVQHDGSVADEYKQISPQYGMIGLDMRRAVNQKMIDLELSNEEFDKKYEKDKTLCELHKQIKQTREDYAKSTVFVNNKILSDNIVMGYYFDQIFMQYE